VKPHIEPAPWVVTLVSAVTAPFHTRDTSSVAVLRWLPGSSSIFATLPSNTAVASARAFLGGGGGTHEQADAYAGTSHATASTGTTREIVPSTRTILAL